MGPQGEDVTRLNDIARGSGFAGRSFPHWRRVPSDWAITQRSRHSLARISTGPGYEHAPWPTLSNQLRTALVGYKPEPCLRGEPICLCRPARSEHVRTPGFKNL